MATFKVECFGAVAKDAGGNIQLPSDYLGTLNITTSTSSTGPTPFPTGTKYITYTTDDTVDIFFKLGNPAVTAATTDRVLKLNENRGWATTDGNGYIATIKV